MANKNPQANEEIFKDPNMYTGRLVPGTIRVLLNGIEKASKKY